MSEAMQGWHLDKRVPVSIILVLIVQLVGGAWLASQMRSDINVNTRDIMENRRGLEVVTQAGQTQAVQLGRIEENVAAMRVDIGRLLAAIERTYQQ